MIKRTSWREKWEMRSDIDSTRPTASLTVSVGRALRDQPGRNGKEVSSQELMLNDEQQLPIVCPEKRVLLSISNVCHGRWIGNGGMCARIYNLFTVEQPRSPEGKRIVQGFRSELEADLTQGPRCLLNHRQKLYN